MRTTAFGDTVIESLDDDLGLVEALQESEGCYALVRADEEGSSHFYFEIMDNESGEPIVTSESIFVDFAAAKGYLKGYVSDVQLQ